MGDHLALLVDRLLTESTLDAAIRKQVSDLQSETVAIDYCCDGDGGSARKMVECRICQDEDWDTSMEAPCACCGSLKYAHRKCIQRWCNEKGDTVCEICLQQFKPGYTAPQQLFHYGSIPMNFRGNWEIARQDLHDSQIITMVPSERDFMDGYEDYLPIRTRSSTLCCRTVAIIFMALLVLRHTLPLMIGGNGEYSLALFSVRLMANIVFRSSLQFYHTSFRDQDSDYVSILLMGAKASCVEDRGNPISDLGHGESIGNLPSSSSPAGKPGNVYDFVRHRRGGGFRYQFCTANSFSDTPGANLLT
ncbi:hypothetical protein E2562_023514 [Oryza meyeriana var. granulata]|uniref:RING-CH-type domain-containing protein n=1 Tax=Oryza meyeriana var. granulata TaxID=110450 RepID=A0A6G1E325_9ORYZ|nr:hypothetical protein E2562_023514 [Oryza meyeriana var. granulata]